MTQSSFKAFDYLLHPYAFALKEGDKIHLNYLDYSLLLLQVGHIDVLSSPQRKYKVSNPFVPVLKK